MICKTFTPDNKNAIILLERSERANKVIANFMPRNIVVLIIAAVVLISVGGAAAYFAFKSQKGAEQGMREKQGAVTTLPEPTSSEIDTSDWKTYRSERYGFEFKYPAEWEVKVFDEANIALYSRQEDFEPISSIAITENPGCIPLERHLPTYYFDPKSDFSVTYINGKLVYRFWPYITYGGESEAILVTDEYFMEISNPSDTLLATLNLGVR